MARWQYALLHLISVSLLAKIPVYTGLCFQIKLTKNERFSKELDMCFPASENKTKAGACPRI